MQLPFLKKKAPLSKREYLFALEIDHFSVKSSVWGVINNKTQVLSVGIISSWDDQSETSLITAADESLSDAAAKLDPKGSIQPSKVIFGLPPDWVESEKILPVRLPYLKALSGKLSLSPVGYVITPEASVRYIQSTEGVPPTAILLGFWKHHLEVTLVRLGKIDAVHLVHRSENPVADVVEGLSRFAQLDMLPSRILLYDSGADLEDIRQKLLSHPWQAPQTRLPFLHFPKIESLPSEFTIRAISLAGGTEVAQAIGLFVETPLVQEETSASPEDLGFSPATTSTPALKIKANLSFGPIAGLIVVIVLLVGLLVAYWFLPKATVTLHLEPKSLGAQFELTADKSVSQVDNNQAIIPARTIEVSSQKNQSLATTGTKLVGDRATGEVTLINGTSSSRTLPAGTILTSTSGLKFVTDTKVDIASASGTADPNSYQPGKATVKITASDIGTESNLTAGVSFRVGNFASLDMVAKNEAAFTGGTSREIQVVHKNDIAKLKSEVELALKSDSSDQISAQISEKDILVNTSLSHVFSNQSYDKKDGDAADQIEYSASIKTMVLIISKTDLEAVAQNQLQAQIPSGYYYANIKAPDFSVVKSQGNKFTLSVKAISHLLPQLDESKIVSDIAGKNPDAAEQYLLGVQGVKSVDYEFHLSPPKPFLTIPRVLRNITLHVEAN